MFWDSSALVPTFLPEARSPEFIPLFKAETEPTVWWGTLVEGHSAFYRRPRKRPFQENVLSATMDRLSKFFEDADTIAATERIRQRAVRLLAVHALRASDAFQLGSALVWCEERPKGVDFICLDDRLREAARREGFKVLPAA